MALQAAGKFGLPGLQQDQGLLKECKLQHKPSAHIASGLGNAPRIRREDNEGLRQVSKLYFSKSHLQHHPKSGKVSGLGKDHTRNAHHRDTGSLLCAMPFCEAQR